MEQTKKKSQYEILDDLIHSLENLKTEVTYRKANIDISYKGNLDTVTDKKRYLNISIKIK